MVWECALIRPNPHTHSHAHTASPHCLHCPPLHEAQVDMAQFCPRAEMTQGTGWALISVQEENAADWFPPQYVTGSCQALKLSCLITSSLRV